MKKKRSRRILSMVVALCMVAALLPASALASTTVTPNSSSSNPDTMEVEYFSSTLYNWDENKANLATQEADKADDFTVSWSSTSVSYSNSSNYSTYTSGSYYVLVDDEYYVVTGISCTRSGRQYNYTYSWTITYDGGSTTSSNSLITLYYQNTSSTSYEGKGFYFTESSSKEGITADIPSYSMWVTNGGYDQNYMIYSGLAASKLSDSSNAPFCDEVNAANLFATDGSNTDYTDVYTDVQVPFVYDEETGYYTLSSDDYAVYFAGGTGKTGATMEIADKPAGYSANVASGSICGFAPFNAVNLSSTGSYVKGNSATSETTTGYTISGSMQYGFGMVTSVDFQMTDDGKDENGDPITFEFSGDDDVWVYIDDVLVLDIGGTHDAIKGEIDFSTGEVTLTASKYSYIGDKATGTVESSNSMNQTNLYDALTEASGNTSTLTSFAAEGTHTMTIYYMDRGQGATNCLIKFNLPQEDSLSVTKDIADTYTDDTVIDEDTLANLNNIDFSFTLYNNGTAVGGVNYSLYDSSGIFVQTGSTDSNGQFTLKNGYTAVFNGVDLDEAGTWQVVENLSSSRWATTSTYTATINSSTTTGEGNAAGGIVTLAENSYIGSELSADSIAYIFTNQYVKGEDPDVDVYDETIVLDYGLPVEVDVTANDITTLYGKSIGEDYNPNYELDLVESITTTTNGDGNETTTVETTDKLEGTYGYATVNDDGNIVYTLTEDFCGIETVQYQYSVTVTVVDDEGETITKTGSAIGTLTIIPATSVYYEENFSYTGSGSSFTSSNKDDWNDSSNFITIATGDDSTTATFSVEGNSEGGYQETGLVGTTGDSTYGTDAIYLTDLCDSQGTSLKVDTSNCSAQYKYTFTGTGTTIYGRVAAETGYIRVTVYDEISEEYVETQFIDTVNLITSSDEDDENASNILAEVLYNIPIYQQTSLQNGYSTYTVRIYVYPENTPTGNADGSGGEFYLDGIRVFQPMGTSADDNVGYETAASAYATDGEENVSVINIHQKVITDYDDAEDSEGYTSGDNIFTLTDINGDIQDIETYSEIGPNEEFYLSSEGDTLSFALVNWSSTKYKIYLGMKAPAGLATSATFSSYAYNEDETSGVMGTIEVNNSTDCYYDISSYVDVKTLEDGTVVGFVTITSSSGNLLALTNIKVTGTDSFDLGDTDDYEGSNGSSDTGSADDASAVTDTIYMTSTAYAASLFEEEEEEVFEPDSISVSSSYGSKTKKATVTVVTSKDVAYVTINGTRVTGANTSGGKLKFSKSFTKVTKGTEYEVIAYDSNDVASVVYTTTAE